MNYLHFDFFICPRSEAGYKKGQDMATAFVVMEGTTEGFEPKIIAFCCRYCAYAAADLAGILRLQYPPNVKAVLLPCTGRVDILEILELFEAGADGVMVAGCRVGECHFIRGNMVAAERIKLLKTLLGQIGLGSERVEMYNLSSAEGQRFAQITIEMTERIRALGPNPLSMLGGKSSGEKELSGGYDSNDRMVD